MKRIITIIIATIIFGLAVTISQGQQTINNYDIEIVKENNVLLIEESLDLTGTSDGYYENISFWIMPEAEDVAILINGKEPDSIEIVENNYICNISSFNISINDTINTLVNYNISSSIENFQKTIIYPTETLTLEYENDLIYSSDNLEPNFSFSLSLKEKIITSTLTSNETPLINYVVIVILLLIILILVYMLSSLKKTKKSKIQDITFASEELLSTKKTLLLSILKEIEKQHRAKKISDDTYHKLKQQYKQDAVQTMKYLEDIQSKVK